MVGSPWLGSLMIQGEHPLEELIARPFGRGGAAFGAPVGHGREGIEATRSDEGRRRFAGRSRS
ncbi:hypothetical protein PSA01_17780 [Pseudonocardia saturnea]|uniref:Uncharacterized protein n=1 Tax=Pseudonocardia saturnea TaxID=33909 RepID=A0ABQ0RVP4_9PSEU|nr:hypothetical protein Pdca_04130 [Pseudonocardia autotrophica]GEC24749.1 hypothetical protein PSA01_17780 [Pseudonocardia saturnea]